MTTTLTANGPEDLLAAVPVVLGFHPEDSLVMLTFGGTEQFHARLDLPPGPEHIADCVDAVLRPALIYQVQAVAFVLYTADPRVCGPLARALTQRFAERRIRVLDCLRCDGSRWFATLARAGVPAEGVPYDISGHEFGATAVYDGRVTLGSRAELAARVEPDPDLVARTEEALVGATPLSLAGALGLVSRSLARGGVSDPDDLASLLLALAGPKVREQVWSGLRREDAAAHVRLWTDVVRRAPDRLVAHPAAVLAFAAWLQGDGAFAWCAVDRCLDVDAENRLGLMVRHVLAEAVSPSSWAETADPADASASA